VVTSNKQYNSFQNERVVIRYMNYYYMGIREDRIYGIAYVPKGTLLSILPSSGKVETWETLILTLKKGDFPDYLANDRGLNLYSRKLRDILDRMKSDQDELQWLPVIVRTENGEEREYFVLHFPHPCDVIDKEKSVFGPSLGKYYNLIKPVISRKLATNHQVFTIWGREGIAVIVSDSVKKSIQTTKCAGVVFEKAAATD
jgi:hypothetical protein